MEPLAIPSDGKGRMDMSRVQKQSGNEAGAAPMTADAQPQGYIVDILAFDVRIEKYVKDFATFTKREKEETVEEIHDILMACSRPHTPAPEIDPHTCESRYQDQPGMKWKCNHPEKKESVYCDTILKSGNCPRGSQIQHDAAIARAATLAENKRISVIVEQEKEKQFAAFHTCWDLKTIDPIKDWGASLRRIEESLRAQQAGDP